jgi:hypothetical protein
MRAHHDKGGEHVRRLLSIAAIAAIAVASIAAPASAGTSTRYVDDDGTAGAAGCNGSRSVPSTIADGIDAAGPGDTILVCPGKYRETIRVDVQGVTIRAVERWKAVLAPRSVSGAPIVEIASDGVTLQWLKIVAPTTGACDSTIAGIAAWEVDDAQIVANRVLADPKGVTFGGSCGLFNGIEIGDGSERASVRNNLVRDFRIFGIRAWSSDAKFVNNSIQYWHRTVCPVADASCRKGPGTAAVASSTGIGFAGSSGVVSLNAITNAPEGDRATTPLVNGIDVSSSPRLAVRRNLVKAAGNGILANDSNGLALRGNVVIGPNPPRPARATPAGEGARGLWIVTSTDVRIRDNHALQWTTGVVLYSGVTATIVGNDFTGNSVDCFDSSGSDNTWDDNLGNTDVPADICTDGPIQDIPGSPT